MADPQQFRLRVTFCKKGRLALLSHLEVAHALERAVRRAGLPFAISQGFSPHMKIAFGAALPVGVGSTCEIFDLQLTSYVPAQEALALLQQASVEDLMCTEAAYIEPKAKAASVAYPVSTYTARLTCAPHALPVPSVVTVVRKKKVKQLRVADYLVGDMRLEGAEVTFSLEAKPTGSLRPDKLLEACLVQLNGNAPSLADVAADLEEPVYTLVGNAQPLDAPGESTGKEGDPVRVATCTRTCQR